MGWGTFIVDNSAERAISHQAPHPLYEYNTDQQAIGLFKSTDAHSFLMCGAHRYANGIDGSCQQGTTTEEYGEADCAHNNANMFTMANLELDAFYGASPWTAIQWHGMDTDKCGTISVYMSQGFNDAPVTPSKLNDLKQLITAYQQPNNWIVKDPGDGGGCNKNGTDNVQGRILNGVPYDIACSKEARGPVRDKFIHIEQKDYCRDAAAWSQAVLDTWQTTP
jgi:hypothetical protein